MLREKVLRPKLVSAMSFQHGDVKVEGDTQEEKSGDDDPEKFRKSKVVSQWAGLVHETREEQVAAADPSQLEGLARPTAVKVNKTIRKWQKRAMYGNPQRATHLPVDNAFKVWYIEQRDRHRVDLPECLLAEISREAVGILSDMRDRYEKVLGPEDFLVQAAQTRIEEISETVDIQIPIKRLATEGGTKKFHSPSLRFGSSLFGGSSIRNSTGQITL